MARIIDWTEADVDGLSKANLARLVAEIADDGRVTRELGFDHQGRLAHRCPGTGQYGAYGLFDNSLVDPTGRSDLTEQQFEELWALQGFQSK